MAELRSKPYFWVTWLASLLSGEHNCEWKVWRQGHYSKLDKLSDDFNSSQWNENHTALLNSIRDEYKPRASRILMEDQTKWTIEGKTAIVAGKMDLITFDPNLVIDAKSGRRKDADVMQVKIYLHAINVKAVPGVSGNFTGLLRYTDQEVPVAGVDDLFRDRFNFLVRRLANRDAPATVPSLKECKYCKLADCQDRVQAAPTPAVLHTEDF